MKPNTPIYRSLESAAQRTPQRVAVIDATMVLTYDELLRRIDRRASSLLKRCRPGAAAGVLLDSSVDTVVTYYACLRAGVLYAPLPAEPEPVLNNLIGRAGIAVLVTDRSIETPIAKITADEPMAGPATFPDVDPALPAHLLFTSGTATGKPKAVLTNQIGSAYSHAWRVTLAPYADDDAVGCNIFGIWDVVPALASGVPVVMIPDAALRDPLALAGTIVRHGITRMMLTPSLLAACLASPAATAALRELRLIVLCGELTTPSLLSRAEREMADTRLLDLYSISECHDVAAGFITQGRSRLRPAPFADVRLVDPEDRERPVEIGATGRVVVCGPGVALGELDDDSDRFFEQNSQRCYDTGDLAVRHASDELTIIGRADSRVKIRGRWVDPGEVEAALLRHPSVVHATVRAEAGRLIATVVGQECTNLIDDLRGHLGRQLPPHAVPDRIERVDQPSLAPSGKASRRPLAPPETDLSAVVLAAFRQVLGVAEVTPDDDFTDLGGNSLDAVALCGELQRLSGHPLSVSELLRAGRPREVATLLKAAVAGRSAHRWRLAGAVPPIERGAADSTWQHPLVTGSTGFLGQAIMRRLGAGTVELRRPDMDLDRPLLGLGHAAFSALAREIDGILHLAARVDPFADFESLYRTNVQGTLELIRLAGIRGVPFRYVSSSAVLPLGTTRVWTPETEPSRDLAAALSASGADAYSYTKLGAEIALWRAAARRLPVRIVRIPHLLGHPSRDRLLQTLEALCAAGVYPEGPWRWQFVTRALVTEALLDPGQETTIRHVALPPAAIADLVDHLELDLKPVPMAAIATAVGNVDRSHPSAAGADVLRQLISEQGPIRALSMNDAMLSHVDGNPLDEFRKAYLSLQSGPAS